MSWFCVFCTKFIKTITFRWNSHELVLCDCLGLEDNRGIKLEVAKNFDVIISAKACNFIVPFII